MPPRAIAARDANPVGHAARGAAAAVVAVGVDVHLPVTMVRMRIGRRGKWVRQIRFRSQRSRTLGPANRREHSERMRATFHVSFHFTHTLLRFT
jgi:hypothetical protein